MENTYWFTTDRFRQKLTFCVVIEAFYPGARTEFQYLFSCAGYLGGRRARVHVADS